MKRAAVGVAGERRSRGARASALGACALLAWALAGCGPATEIVLVVDSDLPAAQVDTWWIRVEGAQASCHAVPAAEAVLPLTLSLLPRAGEPTVVVTAAAFPEGARPPACDVVDGDGLAGALVHQRARATFVQGERRVLLVTLEASCQGVPCDGGEELSCRGGRCGVIARPLEPWTGQLPRIDASGRIDAGPSRPDAAPTGDAGPRDDASLPADGGRRPPDGGPPDGGSLDAGPPPSCPSTTRALIRASADSMLVREACSGTCGGAINHGAGEVLNAGVGRPILRFVVPPEVSATPGRLVAARLHLSRAVGHPACAGGGCSNTGSLQALPMRSDWAEGEAGAYTGANWCRRTGGSATCGTWAAEGASGAMDVGAVGATVAVSMDVPMVTLPVDPSGLLALGEDGRVAVQVRAMPRISTATSVFVANALEGGDLYGPAPMLELEYCP